jgi:hypothetical protein
LPTLATTLITAGAGAILREQVGRPDGERGCHRAQGNNAIQFHNFDLVFSGWFSAEKIPQVDLTNARCMPIDKWHFYDGIAKPARANLARLPAEVHELHKLNSRLKLDSPAGLTKISS